MASAIAALLKQCVPSLEDRAVAGIPTGRSGCAWHPAAPKQA